MRELLRRSTTKTLATCGYSGVRYVRDGHAGAMLGKRRVSGTSGRPVTDAEGL